MSLQPDQTPSEVTSSGVPQETPEELPPQLDGGTDLEKTRSFALKVLLSSVASIRSLDQPGLFSKSSRLAELVAPKPRRLQLELREESEH